MTKVELIEKMAKDADISKTAADKALNSFIDSIKKSLKKGNKVTLLGSEHFLWAKELQGRVVILRLGQRSRLKHPRLLNLRPERHLRTLYKKLNPALTP